jgi:uncharacterized protein YjlB
MATDEEKVNRNCEVQHFHLKDDGTFPNSYLPVLLFKNVLRIPTFFGSHFIKKLFASNNWSNSWRSGIFTYHHYHSITHEVLGVYKGKATIQLGGETGVKVLLEKGDVLLIPAGVAHKNLDSENSIKCVGAYPNGKDYDMNYGKAGERPQADKNIYAVQLPAQDPVFGAKGKMQEYWKL